MVLENRDGLRGAVWCRGAKLNFAENLLTRADDTPVVMMDMPPLLDFMALKSSRNLGNRMTVIHISKGRTKHMLVGALLASVMGAGIAATKPSPAAGEYSVVAKIPGGDSIAAWDHAIIDPATGQLFLAGVSTTPGKSGVASLDLASNRAVAPFVPVGMPHGIAILGGGNAAVADASKNQVTLFNEKSGELLETVATGKPASADAWKTPDVMIRDPKTGLLIAGNHDIGQLALVDPKLLKVVGKIEIGGELEEMAARGDGTLFVNVEDQGTVAVVDLLTQQVVKRFPMEGCEGATGLAYDAPNDMIVSVCANGLAKFLDATQGTELASLNVGKGADGVIYDPSRKTIFIPGGNDGKLSIIRFTDRHDIKLIQTIAIPLGTRLGAIDVNTGKVYLPNALPDMKAPPLRLPGLPPIPPAAKGSFEYLVVAPRSQ